MSDEPPRSAAWNSSRSAAGDRNPWLVAVVVSIATFMVVLDTAIANVSLRYIAGSLAASVDESTWVVSTYLIANAVILPASGWLSNVLGRKRFYMICVAVFTVSSLFCGLAPSLGALIFFRIIQGLGGGGMPTSEQAILADTFPPSRRGQAFALYGVAVIVAPTVGPTIGGWITDNFSWHWIFFINVPIGIASLALVHWLVDEPEVLERERAERLAGGLKVDWVGFALIAMTLGCLEVVLDRGQIDDWFKSGTIITFSVLAAIAFLAFVPWELNQKEPIVELRLLFHRQFGMAFCVMLMIGAILFGSNQIMPQLLQTAFPYTAMLSGLAMMWGGIAMLVIMPIAGVVTGRFQPKYLMVIGLSGIALSMWYSTSLTPDASFDYFSWVRVYQMVGLPFLFIPINTVAYDGLPAEQDQSGLGADERRPQSRRQRRHFTGQCGVDPTRAIPSIAAGRKYRAVVASIPLHGAAIDPVFHVARRSAWRCQRPGHGTDRPVDPDPGDAVGLYRRLPCLRHSGGTDDSAGFDSGPAGAYSSPRGHWSLIYGSLI